MRSLSIILFFICILIFRFQPAPSQQYGLDFAGHEVSKDRRTSLDLTSGHEILVKNEFELSFDISLHPNIRFYGYVFRVIFDDTSNIDLICSIGNPGDDDFSLVKGSEKSDISFNLDGSFMQDNWLNFRIKFRPDEDMIVFYQRDTLYVDRQANLQSHETAKIYFGACNHKHFNSTDVPPIMIRDIKIHEKGKLRHHWPLNETDGEHAIDIINNTKAKVINPNWNLKKHLSWEPLFETFLKGWALAAFNPEEELLYLVGEEGLLIYSPRNNTRDSMVFKDKSLFLLEGCQAVYDAFSKKIISYCIDTRQLFFIDPITGEITQEQPFPDIETEYWQHNKYYIAEERLLYVFNGYGQHTYRNQVQTCNIETGTWESLEPAGDYLHPRYLAALGYNQDTVYILGGYGSESGKQMLAPKNYYELYAFALSNHRFVKKTQYLVPEEDYVFANSMVIEPGSRTYYALAFPQFMFEGNLQIMRGSLDNDNLDRVGDRIPYSFHDINSFADLFYFKESRKLIAVTMLFDNLSRTSVKLYSINMPPLPEPLESSRSDKKYLLFGGIILLLLMVLGILYFRRRNFRNKQKAKTAAEYIEGAARIPGVVKNALYFFGGFQVFNKDGAEITHRFSPLLKELFLLIVMNSYRNNIGISSERIIEILWFKKSKHSARNNLAVNIAKLKIILAEIDFCRLSYESECWKIKCKGEGFICDYEDLNEIIDSKSAFSRKEILRLVGITNKGQLLVNEQYEWLDEFKSKISERIIDVFLSCSRSLDRKREADLLILIADCIFHFDIANEEAMIMKCQAQYTQGKFSLANSTYMTFFNEYKNLYDEEYNKSFSEIISG
jgi:DNA-binding SARP family transcriptional activator